MNDSNQTIIILVSIVLSFVLVGCSTQNADQEKQTSYATGHIDIAALNSKFTEIKKIGVLVSWTLSNNEELLTLKVNNDWDIFTLKQKAELTRRFIDTYASTIQNNGKGMYDFCIDVVSPNGIKLAHDCGSYAQSGKNPEIFY